MPISPEKMTRTTISGHGKPILSWNSLAEIISQAIFCTWIVFFLTFWNIFEYGYATNIDYALEKKLNFHPQLEKEDV